MVPVIDISRDDAVDEVRAACEEVGFLAIVGHGVAEETVEEVASRSRAFFDLPDEEKRRFADGPLTPGLPVYRPLRAERLGATGGGDAPADLKQSLDWGPTLPGVAWPDDLERPYRAYYAEMHRVARRLRGLLALALGRDEAWFEPYADEASSSLRVIDYPETGPAYPEGQLRAGAHRDYGFLTILRTEDAPGGLQVQTRAGEWVDVPAIAGAFVVNLGDLLAEWTGGRWVSTLHRVVLPPPDAARGSRRQSLVFFHNPRADAYIETLGTTAGAYVQAKADAAFGAR